ncbi:MAG: zinc ABC transporter substrate-binding protein [Rhodobiaceae bacterium]|nr:zinc ABC transporter substrate-binding protein [Rhodobiaceae bacterium]OUT75098.1 MAG: zinc ABC transporter substrate-binding protein [Rhizobiales bacterium TMED25]
MKKNNSLLNMKSLVFGSVFLLQAPLAEAAPAVVTSIKPIHSLVSNVMNGVGEPYLIITDTNSPHSFTLKPEDASKLQGADIVFWIGEEIETFLEKPLGSIAIRARKISFMESDDIQKLKFRENSIFDEHDDHDDHEEHDDHDKHDDHGHHHGEFDSHIWLDPINAKEIVSIIADELSLIDPSNKSKYIENAKSTATQLDNLIRETEKTLDKDISYVVFHDAYQYFEERFNVAASGALTLNTDVLPGARQIMNIRELIEDKNISCILSEPQFNPKIIETIAEDTNIKTGVLDPLGATIPSGKDQYFLLIDDLAASLEKCS